ncbi:MAG: hypothetical protein ACP5SB_04450 [Caldisericaceae bacterium]
MKGILYSEELDFAISASIFMDLSKTYTIKAFLQPEELRRIR